MKKEMTRKKLRAIASSIAMVGALIFAGYALAGPPPGYKGKPFQDQVNQSGPQVIPGTVQLALFDLGGEGIAYHMLSDVNQGAKLNHTSFMHKLPDATSVLYEHCRPGVPQYICFFRESDGVSISYTKDFADYSARDLAIPPKNQLYLGWERFGEWTNYTVRVKRAGRYEVIALYGGASNTIKLDVDGRPACECKLPVDTGSPHVWNKAIIGTITFSKRGLHLLTLHYGEINLKNNLAFLEFVPAQK